MVLFLSEVSPASNVSMRKLTDDHGEFKIPPPYKAWCHACPDGGRGFMTIEEIREHHITVHGGYRV